MPTAGDTIDEADLERELLRKGVGALEAGRHSCDDCGRTPLVGERVHRYERPAGASARQMAGEGPRSDLVVCELCRLLRREQPQATHLMRHWEHGLTVRRRGAA